MSAAPTKYTRNFDFNSFSTANPTTPHPGNQIDAELNELKTTTDAIIDRLAEVQRPDGQVANVSIGNDQLKPEVTASLGTYQTNAANSAAAAAASAASALASQNTATTKAGEASTSATNAAASATAADGSKTAAAASAAAALASQNAAAASQTAANTSAVNAAADAATANTKATEASASAQDAATSEAEALARWNDFRGRYYGALAANPAVDPVTGAAPDQGDFYFNTATFLCRFYSAGAWVEGIPAASGVSSFNGRIGAVGSQAGDYNAGIIGFTPVGSIAATDVQAAIAELDADVTATVAALAGKASTAHGHAIADVTGLQTALDGKSATGHTHTTANVTGLDTALAGKQPLDATLTAYAALNGVADRLPYFTAADAFALATFTAAGRALVDDADATAQRTTLGLGALATLGSVATANIADDAVTFAKFQNITTARLLGRTTAAAGNVEEISASGGLSLSGGILSVSDTRTLQVFHDQSQTPVAAAAAIIAADDTAPLSTEGVQLFSRAITPQSASSRIRIEGVAHVGASTQSIGTVLALFSGTTCIAVFPADNISNANDQLSFHYEEASGSTTARTYSLRVGSGSGTIAINMDGGGGGNYGSKVTSCMTTQEYLP